VAAPAEECAASWPTTRRHTLSCRASRRSHPSSKGAHAQRSIRRASSRAGTWRSSGGTRVGSG
jgi:hypothetical protein